jgi:predicted nucleotide-binding protein (sugar kinase/HSP70/actin superfamily)
MKLTIPHMGLLHIGYARVLESYGVQLVVPPPPNEEALRLGTRYAPEFACLPFKLNLGNMIQALEQGATDILMPGGFGPCRFGYYSVIQELILKRLGFSFRMARADDPDSLRDMIATIKEISGIQSKPEAYRLFFFILEKLAVIDWAQQKYLALKPRERETGKSDRVLKEALQQIEGCLTYPQLLKTWLKIRRAFFGVSKQNRNLLQVGLVGEIFMLLEPFTNMHIEEKLSRMGVHLSKSVWLSDWLNDRFRFKPFRRNQFQLAWKWAKNYMEFPAGGESIKSVGKTLYYARKKYDGVIQIMPFTCMPELVAQTVLSKISQDCQLPILTLIYDEHTGPTGLQTRLEAFVDLLYHKRFGTIPHPLQTRH